MEKRAFIISCISTAFLVLCFAAHTSHADSTLTAYWKFDESTAGSTVVDSSGNGHNGTPENSPQPSTDVPSTITFSDPYSLQFNGADEQYISVPDSQAFASASGSMSVWVKFTDLTQGDMDMIAKRDSGGGNAQFQFGYNGGGNQFKVSLVQNGTHSCCTDYHWSPSPSLQANVWYNIAVVIDANAHTLTWYQNGTSQAVDSIGTNSLGTQMSAPLTLGASYAGNGEFLYGLLDDARFYNIPLSGSQISDIAQGQSGPGVPTPTPTPSPTPTPEPPQSASVSNANSAISTQTSCSENRPSTPDLFQVSTSVDNATLYFTPASQAKAYTISYGTDQTANQFATNFSNSENTGALTYTINSLQQNTPYYFKVQAQNGCMPGNWSQVLTGTTTNSEVISQSQNQIPQTPTPTPSKTISVIKTTQTQTQSSNPKQEGYSVAITVKNNSNPVVGATVELHSIPMRTVTDKFGIARFNNVLKGNHTVLLAYQGFTGQQHIIVTGNKKDIALAMQVELHQSFSYVSLLEGMCIGLSTAVICFFLFVLYRKSKQKKEKKS